MLVSSVCCDAPFVTVFFSIFAGGNWFFSFSSLIVGLVVLIRRKGDDDFYWSPTWGVTVLMIS